MRLPTRTSDLVSNGAILRAADKIVRSARSIAARKHAGRSASAIVLSPPRETNKTIVVNIFLDTNRAPEALAYEYGSGQHDKNSPHFIEIVPINAPFLEFEGTNEFAGKHIKTLHVNHPGVAARPYLKPAVKKHRKELRDTIREEVNKNLRIYIREMSVK